MFYEIFFMIKIIKNQWNMPEIVKFMKIIQEITSTNFRTTIMTILFFIILHFI